MRTATSRVLGFWFAATAVGGFASFNAAAQERDSERERGSILLGSFVTDRQAETRFDSSSGDSGTDIDLEEDLGLESSTSVVRVGGYWWLNDRHRLDFSYFDLSRSASVPIKETIEFGDKTFAIDTALETDATMLIFKADYTFAAIERERGFFGVTGGLYVASGELELRERELGSAETQDITSPLPVMGVRGDYAVTDRIKVRGAMQVLIYETGNVSGRFKDFYIGADYSFTERWAVGLAYNDVSLELSSSDRWLSGHFDWGYDGILLYLNFDFRPR